MQRFFRRCWDIYRQYFDRDEEKRTNLSGFSEEEKKRKLKETRSNYRLENIEKIHENGVKYHIKRKEIINEKHKLYYLENKEKINERHHKNDLKRGWNCC